MGNPPSDEKVLFTKKSIAKGLFYTVLFFTAPLLAQDLQPLDEDFLMFVGEWADEQGDIQAPEALEMLLPKPEKPAITGRPNTGGGETHEELSDE
ncbi:hypothetical protein MJO52_06765 [Microbulbifer variabilis]|uniref:Secreted protein n=1 Tax=Microbulbifer variabilis TaxID=266805 RepID=A0ABY4VEU3_9GAMM|nr:hypothetical protein [Microbulbifer variabilis]USD22834.1 hypothetical protein MJO52_06765 [Microbulbifer variabilis]